MKNQRAHLRLLSDPRAGLRPARPPRGSSKLGAALRLLERSLAAAGLAVAALQAVAAPARQTYIVQLAAEPLATYSGNVAGYAATQAAPGQRFTANTSAAAAYRGLISAQQGGVIATLPGASILSRYDTVLNGFAAVLTPAQAAALKANPLVRAVHADQARQPVTVSTHAFLGLSTPGGVWSRQADGRGITGDDVVIGVIDTGIWPESLSFAPRVSNGVPSFDRGDLAYGPPPARWTGSCQSGEAFVADVHCNNKLIGARYFNSGFKAYTSSINTSAHWTEFLESPRDSLGGASGHGGHGSHTASTAAGNYGVPVVMAGPSLGSASGVAPRARVAVYKVCYTWTNPDAQDGTGSQNNCFDSDAISAIDQAVKDGVDVINFSISGTTNDLTDPIEQAFFRANKAGVFVAAAAGNSGPTNTVAHISPWLTTVGASTHGRALEAAVKLGNGASYTGASANKQALPPKPLIRAQEAGLPGADADKLRLCYASPPVLDPLKVVGKVVVCERGEVARVDKSAAVLAAGGAGMVLVDNGGGLVADVHAVPTVHVSGADGAAIQRYALTSAPQASMSAAVVVKHPAPIMANFSSRGPNGADRNIMKPDLTAPGVDVIAAVTPALDPQQRAALGAGAFSPPTAWAAYEGTSMATPHVAGAAALLRQAHRSWSPSAIKSALMTTAAATLDDGLQGMQRGQLPWSQGAGHITPLKSLDPGLVYDTTSAEYSRYLCLMAPYAESLGDDCATYGKLDQSYNLNQPAITVGTVPGVTKVVRRVTNVSPSASSYTASIDVPGYSARVEPAVLTLQPGESKEFTVSIANESAALGQWSYGSLRWSDGTHEVVSPVTVRADLAMIAPALVKGSTASGVRLVTVRTGPSGRLTAVRTALKEMTLHPVATLSPRMAPSADLKKMCARGVAPGNVAFYPFPIPQGVLAARFALRTADTDSLDSDFDIGVLGPDGSWSYSGNDGSDESVELLSPKPGTYMVCVLAYDGKPQMTHRLGSWMLEREDSRATNFNVLLPSRTYSFGSATVGFRWSGLQAGKSYLGGVQYRDESGALLLGATLLSIEPGAASAPQGAQRSSTRDRMK